ncbi:DUF7144 family membrane protein [Myceligenerans indicum]|uniref:DUF7144 domain-containing protein n=1 Tax=Myceligenerans indicum TaxID=2593663 RepID=A0ABS1LJK5_9MICO|nr:hypothetical protein [Myceligenerans indicum]MBL0886409.1 hypothetical protein [Myceligenerans indicum]
MATQPTTPAPVVTAWAGWVWFGATMLVTLGLFQVIQALVALLDDGFAVALESGLVVFDLNTWGWTHLAIGALLVIAGIGVFAGALWGRVIGVIVAAISILVQITVLPVYPIWALIVIVLDSFVIYALIVHGEEVRAA